MGVSRQSVHAWIVRYLSGGIAGLADRSSRPRSCPHQAPESVEIVVTEMRREHPRWGAKRIRRTSGRGGLLTTSAMGASNASLFGFNRASSVGSFGDGLLDGTVLKTVPVDVVQVVTAGCVQQHVITAPVRTVGSVRHGRIVWVCEGRLWASGCRGWPWSARGHPMGHALKLARQPRGHESVGPCPTPTHLALIR